MSGESALLVLDGGAFAVPAAIAVPDAWGALNAASWRSTGLILTVAVLAILLLREALPAGRAGRRSTGRKALTFLAVPLTLLLSVVLLGQLAAVAVPVFASEFATTASAPSVAQAATATPVATATAPAPTSTAAVVATPVEPSAAPEAETPPTATPVIPTPTIPVSARTPAQVASTVTALRSGEIDVTIVYTNGFSSLANVRFDLGTGQQLPRLASVTTFQGATGTRTTERVVIGTQAWTRETGGAWIASIAPVVVRDEILALLPDPATVQAATGADAGALRWFDPQRNADARLELAPITGVPQRMVQTSRGTGTVLTARYQGWNTAVTIDVPVAR